MTKSILLCSKSHYAANILLRAAALGCSPDLVLTGTRSGGRGNRLKGFLEILKRGFRPAAKVLSAKLNPPLMEGLAPEVRWGGVFNSEQMVEEIKGFKPDFIFLAGCPIISEEILSLAPLGVYNAHPGLLPWCRGVGVVEQAVLRAVPVGITIHRVDPGIDTGDIVHRELIPLSPSITAAALRELTYDMQAGAFARFMSRLRKSGQAAAAAKQTERYKICGWPSPQELEKVEQILAGGSYHRLVEDWVKSSGRVLPLEFTPSSVAERFKVR
ncbi:MAG: formyltransferase family protein [Vulcanimicrobiota bacterium]